jgi:hypothetical protein
MRARVDSNSTKESGAVVIGRLSALPGWWRVSGEHLVEGLPARRHRVAAAQQDVPGVGLGPVERANRGAVGCTARLGAAKKPGARVEDLALKEPSVLAASCRLGPAVSDTSPLSVVSLWAGSTPLSVMTTSTRSITGRPLQASSAFQ